MIPRLVLLCTIALSSEAKVALLVGIGDYSATTLRCEAVRTTGREWPDLPGPPNDVDAFANVLVSDYGFERRNIFMLIDQQATRAAILRAIEERLVRRAGRNEVVLFFFAGHGSQVRNSLSDEPDKLDESIVPADSRIGARDIRDKELRPLFNRILDRGARLTVILDNCHSGSGARGVVRPRGLRPDLRDVADRTGAGPRPEDRGALVLTASRDFDLAWDMRDAQGTFHGVFTWALLHAMRNAARGEPAEETFLRAHARVKRERPFQEPVLAGNGRARQSPLLGTEAGRRTPGPGVAWQTLESPSPWRLHIRDARTGKPVDRIVGQARYDLVARPSGTSAAGHRHVYAFVIDSAGRTILLFPRNGSVENRFPLTGEVHLGRFEGAPPYGIDTFWLLSTDEPLPNPWRVHGLPAGANGSVEKISLESIPPATPQSGAGGVFR